MNTGLRDYPALQSSVRLFDPYDLTPQGRSRCVLNANFQDHSGPTGHTWFTGVNWTGFTREAVDVRGLLVEHPGVGNVHRVRLIAIPSGDFEAVLTIGASRENTINFPAGLYLTDGTTAGAGNQLVLGAGGTDVGQRMAAVWRYTNFTTLAATQLTGRPYAWEPVMTRLTKSGATWKASWSVDGRDWMPAVTVTPSGTPSHVGFGFFTGAAGQYIACFKSLRIFTPSMEFDSIGQEHRLLEIFS